jgi:hypothetical protein
MSSPYIPVGAILTGRTGPSGPDGIRGPTGPSGPAGSNGINGATGPSGASGPTGEASTISGPSGPSGVFTVPPIVVNPSGTQKIFIIGNTADGNFDPDADTANRLCYSDNNGTTWQDYTLIPGLTNPRCLACNSSGILLVGAGNGLFSHTIDPSSSFIVSFAGSTTLPSINGVSPIITRIVWWPYYRKFLIVLNYTLVEVDSGIQKQMSQIWQLETANATLLYSLPMPDFAEGVDAVSYRILDINVKRFYVIASVYDEFSGTSRILYSGSGGSSWTMTDSTQQLHYTSVIPYYESSWLRLGFGEYEDNSAPPQRRNPVFASGDASYHPIGSNGAVSLSIDLSTASFDSTYYPASLTTGSSYQISTPTDAGNILGAAFNGQVWSVIVPATYNVSTPGGTTKFLNSSDLTVFTSYDLSTATSGYIHNITFQDSTTTSRNSQISFGLTPLLEYRTRIIPRIVWTGTRFVIVGVSTNSARNAGILTSQYGTNWSSVTTGIPTARTIRDICFTPVSVTLTKGVDEYKRYMISANTIFAGDIGTGYTVYVKNIGLTTVEVTVGNKTVLLPASYTSYGGQSSDAVITKNPGESMTIN